LADIRSDPSHIVLIMTAYSSAELAALADHVPVAAADRGLLFVADAEFNREADVELSGATVALDSALAIAAAAQAPFVSLSETRFHAELLRSVMTDDDNNELPLRVERVITKAISHEGEIEVLTLQWPAHGLIFEWTAGADWHDELWANLSEATAVASQASAEELEEAQKIHNEQLRKFEAKLASSREFRGASIQKRRAIAESIAGTISDDLVDSWGFRTAVTEAGRVAKRTAYELSAFEKRRGSACKRAVSCHRSWRSLPQLKESELVSQRPVHCGDVQEGRVKRLVRPGNVGNPCGLFGVIRMRRVGQGIHNLLVAGKSSGVFQRAASGPVDQPGRRTVFVRGPAGNQLEPVKPAVTKIVFVERGTCTQREQLIQGAILLGPVIRFFAFLPGKPLQGFRNFAVDRPQRREGILRCEPVQVHVLPAKDCLQDLMDLIQG
jgi:hypothetical protein